MKQTALLFVALASSFLQLTVAGDAAPPQPASFPGSSFERRARSTDTCAYLNTNDPDLGQLQSCFCLSGVSAYINYKYASETGARRRQLRQHLRDLITANGQVCNYPPDSRPNCQQGAPCLFSCTRGYTPNQQTNRCECTRNGRIDCGGRCVRGTACVSGMPVQRRELPPHEASSRCPSGKTLCGVRSSRGSQSDDWECIDTTNSLESCGGCMYPYGNGPSTGRDCTAIDGVNSVSCTSGYCQVDACGSGFSVADNKTMCVRKIAARKVHHDL
ncbi:hypothetical protein HGRIS_010649 [Hohenbuehelia grisea]|uniref:Protein CPL1-like domain-containing protein n=1 Tax=Hohenbuehelia grisea TaxID=104357 RepID=A0ABR3IXQ3_9AGAR